MSANSIHEGRPMRARLFHYVVLETFEVWREFLTSRHLDDDVRRNNPAFLPSIVGLASVDLIRMGYPLRTRLDFQNPMTTPGFDIVRCPDLHGLIQVFLDQGLILKPDSYFPNYQLTWEGASRLKSLRELGLRTQAFLAFDADAWYFAAALGVDYNRARKPAEVADLVHHWVETVATSDLSRIRQIWIETAVQLYRESDWIGDFTFDPVYAKMASSPLDYRAVVAAATGKGR